MPFARLLSLLHDVPKPTILELCSKTPCPLSAFVRSLLVILPSGPGRPLMALPNATWPKRNNRSQIPPCFLPLAPEEMDASFVPQLYRSSPRSAPVFARASYSMTASDRGSTSSSPVRGQGFSPDVETNDARVVPSDEECESPTRNLLNRVRVCTRPTADPCDLSRRLLLLAYHTLKVARKEEQHSMFDKKRSGIWEAKSVVAELFDGLIRPQSSATLSSSVLSQQSASMVGPAPSSGRGTTGLPTPLDHTSPRSFSFCQTPAQGTSFASTPHPSATPKRSPKNRRNSAYLSLLSTLKNQFCMLQRCDLTRLNHEERLAFWLNVLNAGTLCSLAETSRPPGRGPLAHASWISFLKKSTFEINGQVFSLIDIEHKVLRRHSSTPSTAASSIVMPIVMAGSIRPNDSCERNMLLTRPAPEAVFGVSHPIKQGSPSLRVFRPEAVKPQLLLNCAHYLAQSLKVDVNKQRAYFPVLFHVYRQDWPASEILEFARATLLAVPSAVEGVERLTDRRASQRDQELAVSARKLAEDIDALRDPKIEGPAGFARASIKYLDFDWAYDFPAPARCPELVELEEIGLAAASPGLWSPRQQWNVSPRISGDGSGAWGTTTPVASPTRRHPWPGSAGRTPSLPAPQPQELCPLHADVPVEGCSECLRCNQVNPDSPRAPRGDSVPPLSPRKRSGRHPLAAEKFITSPPCAGYIPANMLAEDVAEESQTTN